MPQVIFDKQSGMSVEVPDDGTSIGEVQNALKTFQTGEITEHRPSLYERLIKEPLQRAGSSWTDPLLSTRAFGRSVVNSLPFGEQVAQEVTGGAYPKETIQEREALSKSAPAASNVGNLAGMIGSILAIDATGGLALAGLGTKVPAIANAMAALKRAKDTGSIMAKAGAAGLETGATMGVYSGLESAGQQQAVYGDINWGEATQEAAKQAAIWSVGGGILGPMVKPLTEIYTVPGMASEVSKRAAANFAVMYGTSRASGASHEDSVLAGEIGAGLSLVHAGGESLAYRKTVINAVQDSYTRYLMSQLNIDETNAHLIAKEHLDSVAKPEVSVSPEDITSAAANRLDELNRKANGTPETEVNGQKIPATESQPLTSSEIEERQFLEANKDNPDAIRQAYEFSVPGEETPAPVAKYSSIPETPLKAQLRLGEDGAVGSGLEKVNLDDLAKEPGLQSLIDDAKVKHEMAKDAQTEVDSTVSQITDALGLEERQHATQKSLKSIVSKVLRKTQKYPEYTLDSLGDYGRGTIVLNDFNGQFSDVVRELTSRGWTADESFGKKVFGGFRTMMFSKKAANGLGIEMQISNKEIWKLKKEFSDKLYHKFRDLIEKKIGDMSLAEFKAYSKANAIGEKKWEPIYALIDFERASKEATSASERTSASMMSANVPSESTGLRQAPSSPMMLPERKSIIRPSENLSTITTSKINIPQETGAVKRPVYDMAFGRLRELGYSPEEAHHNATIMNDMAEQAGRNQGMDPVDWYQKNIKSIENLPPGSEIPKGAKQAGLTHPRAWVSFTKDEQGQIVLAATKDATSLQHELSHIWFKDFMRFVASGKASDRVKGDFKIFTDWLKVKNGQEKLTRSQLEQFARGWEYFLAEGVAPKPELQGAFDKFKQWITGVYQDLTHLNVNMTDDVRAAMGRVLHDANDPMNEVTSSKEKTQKFLEDRAQDVLFQSENPEEQKQKRPAVNLSRFKLTPTAEQTIRAGSQAVNLQREKPLTHEEIQARAKEVEVWNKSISREQTLDMEARQLAARQNLNALASKGEVNDEFILALQTVTDFASDAARRLEAQKIEALPESATVMTSMVKKLLKLGVDAEKIKEAAKGVDFTNPNEAADFYRKFVKPSFWDQINEFAYINILSSPLTHIVNTFSNAVQLGVMSPATRLASGAIDAIGSALTGKARERYMSEIPAYYKGAVNAVPEAMSLLGKIMRGEMFTERPDIDNVPTRAKWIDYATLGVGKYVGRALEGMDVFFRTMIEKGEYEALVERHQGPMDEKAQAEIASEAKKRAEYYVFRGPTDVSNKTGQGDLLTTIDKATNAVYGLRRLPGGRWFVRFIRTPMNILKQGIEYSPAGFATLKGAEDKTEQAGKAIVGSMVFAGAYYMAMAGNTTFAAPTSDKEKKLFYQAGKQPYSIKVGDEWVSFSKIGPLAYPMMMASALHYYEQESPSALSDNQFEKGAKAIEGILQFFSDQSYVQSLGDLMNIPREGMSAATKLVTSVPAQLIPLASLQRWVNNLIDPLIRDKEKGFNIQAVVDNLKPSIVGLSQTMKPKEDYYGEPAQKPHQVINAVSPLKMSKEDSDAAALLQDKQERQQEKNARSAERKKEREADKNESP